MSSEGWNNIAVGTLETDLPRLPSRKGTHTEDKLLGMGTKLSQGETKEREGPGKDGGPGNL